MWGGISGVWSCSVSFFGWVLLRGRGVGGCFLIACAAAILACSFVSATYRCRMSSALSTASSSSSIFSSAGVWLGALSVFCISAGGLLSRGARSWERVLSCARRSSFAFWRVVFAVR